MNLERKIYKTIKKALPKKKYFPLSEPNINSIDKKFVQHCLKTGWVSSNGIYLKKFKAKIQKILKKKTVALVINGTSALHLALIASGIKEKEEVIVPDLSYVSAANSVSYIGAVPNFVDIDPENYSICPIKLENYLKKICIKKNGFCFNKKTGRFIKGLILVHVFGYAGRILEIKKICKKFKLKFIEDSSECLGSYYKRRHLGTFGDYGVLSFNGNKIVTSGGGGAVICNSKNKLNLVEHLSKNSKVSHKWKFYHDKIGYNYKLSNLAAALGYSQVLRLNYFLKKRQILFNNYLKGFSEIQEARIHKPLTGSNPNHWLISFRLDKKFSKTQSRILSLLIKKKIYSRPPWELMSSLPMYKKCPKDNNLNAKDVQKSVICLPSSL